MQNKFVQDVETFMTACGQDCPPFAIKDTELSDLYKELIKEEMGEFIDADSEDDDVERMDACFDMMWVIIGYMLARGWNIEKLWEEGAKSNLIKIDAETGKVIKREDGKIMKPEGWTPPNFKQFL